MTEGNTLKANQSELREATSGSGSVVKESRFLSRRRSAALTTSKRYSVDLGTEVLANGIPDKPKSRDLFDQVRHLRTSRF